MTADGANVKLYLNGSLAYSQADSSLPAVDSGDLFIGAEGGGAYPLTGAIDEARVSGTVRGPDWILAEYNNQNSPSTFIAVGSESGVSVNTARHKVTNQ